MRVPRIFVDQPVVAGESVDLGERTARHLLRALRLRPGERLIVFNGDGRDWHANLEPTTQGGAVVHVQYPARDEPKLRLCVHLLLGISKGDRMDYAIQKAVELGVDRITPLFTQRVVVNLGRARLVGRIRHWQGILVSGCEQSGRSRLPVLENPTDLPQALQSLVGTGILLEPSAGGSLLDLAPPSRGIKLLIGPEGGLTAEEIAAAVAIGYRAIRLGPRVLRTETAPIAALAALQTLWGDFC